MNRNILRGFKGMSILIFTMLVLAAGLFAQGGNPFAPEKAPPLPAGMTGSDVNDPRYRLTTGLFDAA